MSANLKPPDFNGYRSAGSHDESFEKIRGNRRPLSRSPHPYHRKRVDDSFLSTKTNGSLNASSSTSSGSSSGGDNRGRRKPSSIHSQSSESGTEADDESFGPLKSLPAPPIDLHKGLRDPKDEDVEDLSSPWLTPSILENDERKAHGNYVSAKARSEATAREEAQKAKQAVEKFLKRRRAELLRRVVEVLLLGAIGYHVKLDSLPALQSAEIMTLLYVAACLFLLYPVRLLFHTKDSSKYPWWSINQRLRIPSTFDPAPLLYPAFIPVCISVSLSVSTTRYILPNVILGLSALPHQLIPSPGRIPGLSVLHWFLSIIPLIHSENAAMSGNALLTETIHHELRVSQAVSRETLVSLYPLQQTLLPPLEYLTKTSLLPAELQLLSVSLCNILIHSSSPQMVIQQAILWGGGLGVFVLCGKVLSWGVALARIPRWRFRRAGKLVSQALQARDAFLGGLKSRKSFSPLRGGDAVFESDADEDGHPTDFRGRAGKILQLEVNPNKIIPNGEPKSAIENTNRSFLNPNGSVSQDPKSRAFQRRHTLPSMPSSSSKPKSTRNGRSRRSTSSISQAYLSLTTLQATLRKWLYALYVYIMVVLIVLAGVRTYVQYYALNGYEPIGWASSYLLGDHPSFRYYVTQSSLLSSWIPLPPHRTSCPPTLSPQRIEHLRSHTFGQANTRLIIIAYCLLVLTTGLLLVFRLSTSVEVDTRRKVFHGIMVLILLPCTFVDPCFISLALILVLAVFLLLDLFRASQLPPLSKPIARFLTPYVDGRDLRGPVVVSHIFLLVGCAIPLWLSLAAVDRVGAGVYEGWEVPTRDVSMVAGVVCVGMGDAAASLVGRRFGRRKWPWAGGKSVEGSLAFATAVFAGLAFATTWLVVGGWEETGKGRGIGIRGKEVMKWAMAACGASLTEAVLTGGNDNVVVPVVLWLLVR